MSGKLASRVLGPVACHVIIALGCTGVPGWTQLEQAPWGPPPPHFRPQLERGGEGAHQSSTIVLVSNSMCFADDCALARINIDGVKCRHA